MQEVIHNVGERKLSYYIKCLWFKLPCCIMALNVGEVQLL
jgi:hypothetical protein